MQKAKFYIESRKDKEGNKITKNVPIRMSFSFNGLRLEYYTQQRMSSTVNFTSDYFKTGKSPVKANEPQAARINKRLREMSAKVELLYDNTIALGQTPSVEYLKEKLDEQFKGKNSNRDQKMVKDAFKEYLDYTKEKKSHATWKKVNSAYNHLQNCNTWSFNKLTFDKIDAAFVDNFKNHLINLNHLNNTVVKYMRCLREFLNWSKNEKRNYYTGNVVFEGLRENEINIIFLNETQLKQLEKAKMPNASLERVKDIYLFGCYTSMRFKDVKNLEKKNILEKEVRYYISKGNKTVWHEIPIVPQSKRILKKYKDLPGDKALPVTSNQKMNKYIKIVMKEAGLDDIQTIKIVKGDGTVEEKSVPLYDLIGFHTSRKTFISYAVEKEIQELDIKSITGHSKNSRAFARYYDVSTAKKRKVMGSIFTPIKKSKAV